MSNDARIRVSISSFVNACKRDGNSICKACCLFVIMLLILVLKYSFTPSVYEMRLQIHIGSVYSTDTQAFWGFDRPRRVLIEGPRIIVAEYKKIFGPDLQSPKTEIKSSSLTLLIRRTIRTNIRNDIELIANRVVNQHNMYQKSYYADSRRDYVHMPFHRSRRLNRTTVRYISTEPSLVGPNIFKYFVFGLLGIIVLSFLYLISQVVNSYLYSQDIQGLLLKI